MMVTGTDSEIHFGLDYLLKYFCLILLSWCWIMAAVPVGTGTVLLVYTVTVPIYWYRYCIQYRI
jgi:hypothetical protein